MKPGLASPLGFPALAASAFVLIVSCGGDDFAASGGTAASGGNSGATSAGDSGANNSGGQDGSGSMTCAGAFACDGADLHDCAEGNPTLVESCATAALCDAANGQCIAPSCDASDHTCAGEVLEACNEDRTGFETLETCATSALCNVSAQTCDAPACDEGEYRCSGSVLEACSADRTDFIEVLDCGTPDACDEGAGQCDLACAPNTYQCNGATLLQCNVAGTALGVSQVCFTAALCNATQGECDQPACAPNAYHCDGANLQVCNDDRTDFTDFQTCASAGLCVAATGSCKEPVCDGDDYECQGNLLRGCKADRTGFEVDETCNASSQDCTLDPPGCRNLAEYASVLDGFTMTMPCLSDYPQSPFRVCYSAEGPCATSADPIFNGAQPFDTTLTFGGNPGTTYEVAVRVQGQVESKIYTGGVDQSSAASLPADGLYTGGTPSTVAAVAYNVYMLRVSSPPMDYFFNSITSSDGDTRVRESTFDVDYEATIQIDGGATMRFVVSDPNCLSTKNCADPAVNGSCSPHNFPNLDAAISDDIGAQPFNGQFLGFLVESVSKQ